MVAAIKAAAGDDPGVRLVDLNEQICTAQTCPVYRDGEVLYHDDSHFSLKGSMSLRPLLAPATQWLAAETRPE